MKDLHVKMNLAGSQGRPIEAVWWNCLDEAERTPDLRGSLDVAYTIETNVWNGEVRMQLNVVDLRICQSA
jgi:RecJ OB domain